MLYSFPKLCSFFQSIFFVDATKDIYYSFFFVLGGGQLHFVSCRVLVSQPGIEPGPVAVKVPSLNPWTTREFSIIGFFFSTLFLLFHQTPFLCFSFFLFDIGGFFSKAS